MQPFILSPQEYKRVRLTGQLNIIFLVSIALFTGMDYIWGYSYPIPFNLVAMGLSIVVLILNRTGSYMAARLLLALLVSVITLFFTAALERTMGLYMFALCINVGLLAAFGYESARMAIAFIAVTTVLYLVAMFHPYPRLDRIELADPVYADRNLIFAFLIASAACVLTVYYLLRVNHQFEAELQEKERAITAKNRELTEVNAELDKFFYSVSHDLRAPLASMQGLLALMEPSGQTPESKEYAQMLKGRVDNLDQFIRSITTYAGNSRMDVKLEKVSLHRVVREVLENLRFQPKASKIEVTVDIPSDLELKSDSTRLQIVFGNLIDNAIKYHDLSKAKPYISISHTLERDAVVVTIADNGTGIRPEVLPRIFDMFYRGHDQSYGSGLGLYIVQEALEKLRGNIDVKSTYNEGSVFTISLPRE